MVTNTTYSNVFPTLNTFPRELPVFFREYSNGMYGTLAYYVAKCLVELPLLAGSTLVLVTLVYWLSNLGDRWDTYIICYVILFLAANSAIAFGKMK